MKISGRAIKNICVLLIAGACIAWVLKGVRFEELLRQMRKMNIWWILPAVILDVFTTIVHGFRWRILLRPLGKVSVFRTVQAIYTSLFSNEIFPLKAGEFVRGYLLSRWLNAPFSSVLPSMVTERVFDGSLLVIGFGISAFFVTLPPGVVKAAVIVGAVMLLAILALIALAFGQNIPSKNRHSDQIARRKPVEHISKFLSHFSRGIRSLRSSVSLSAVLAASFLYLFTQVLAYWMIMRAYGLYFSLWVPTVVLIIVRLGTAVPSAPANIGPYQFFCALALTLFGVEKTTAAGFAIALWLIFSIPILVLGFAAFLRSGLSLSDVKGHPQ